MRRLFLLFLGLAAAAPVAAQDAPMRPLSCERIATAQFDNCSVTNAFRCDEGEIAFWIETIDDDNLLIIETRNPDHGTVSVDYVGQGISMRLSQSKAHPRDTIRNKLGSDTISGDIVLFGMLRPISGETSYVHAGETVDLAGRTFARISFKGSIQFPAPMPEIRGEGTLLYDGDLDLYVEERIAFDFGGDGDRYAIAHLALPGQEGFGDETPGYGCGVLSWLPQSSTESGS
jgi:hypothetical protein